MTLWLCMCTLTPYYHGSFLFTFRWRYVSRLGRLIVTSWQPVTRWLNRGYWRRLKVRGGGGGVHFQPGLLYQYQPSTSLHLAPLGSWKRQHYAVISNHGQPASHYLLGKISQTAGKHCRAPSRPRHNMGACRHPGNAAMLLVAFPLSMTHPHIASMKPDKKCQKFCNNSICR